MAHLQVTIDTDKLKDLFAGDEGMTVLAEQILYQVLDAQMTDHLQAKPYERTERRRAYRDGYKPRQLTTRVGTLTLRVPQARDGQYRRSVMEMGRHSRSDGGNLREGARLHGAYKGRGRPPSVKRPQEG